MCHVYPPKMVVTAGARAPSLQTAPGFGDFFVA